MSGKILLQYQRNGLVRDCIGNIPRMEAVEHEMLKVREEDSDHGREGGPALGKILVQNSKK